MRVPQESRPNSRVRVPGGFLSCGVVRSLALFHVACCVSPGGTVGTLANQDECGRLTSFARTGLVQQLKLLQVGLLKKDFQRP